MTLAQIIYDRCVARLEEIGVDTNRMELRFTEDDLCGRYADKLRRFIDESEREPVEGWAYDGSEPDICGAYTDSRFEDEDLEDVL
jgi:hypothetical protein